MTFPFCISLHHALSPFLYKLYIKVINNSFKKISFFSSFPLFFRHKIYNFIGHDFFFRLLPQTKASSHRRQFLSQSFEAVPSPRKVSLTAKNDKTIVPAGQTAHSKKKNRTTGMESSAGLPDIWQKYRKGQKSLRIKHPSTTSLRSLESFYGSP